MAYVNVRTTASFRDRIAALLASVQENRARNAVYRQTVRELNMLTDRELGDLGINRLSIERIAHEAAFGK
jgi:uncharacterized protein YjiS (DUF1127 family)